MHSFWAVVKAFLHRWFRSIVADHWRSLERQLSMVNRTLTGNWRLSASGRELSVTLYQNQRLLSGGSYQLDRGVTHDQLLFKVNCRQASLGLADQINGQEPNAQRQVGALEQGACNQGCLQLTCIGRPYVSRP
jgi:hypothetical protein